MFGKKLAPIHPGEVLLLEFLEPMEMSQSRLARDIGVPPRRINEIVLKKRRITADTALRLGKYFQVSPDFWLGLQMDFDLDTEIEVLKIDIEGAEIEAVNRLLDTGSYRKAKRILVETHERKIHELREPTEALRNRIEEMGIDHICLDWH